MSTRPLFPHGPHTLIVFSVFSNEYEVADADPDFAVLLLTGVVADRCVDVSSVTSSCSYPYEPPRALRACPAGSSSRRCGGTRAGQQGEHDVGDDEIYGGSWPEARQSEGILHQYTLIHM